MPGSIASLLLIELSKTLSRRQRGASESGMQSGGTRPLGATDESLPPLDRVMYFVGTGAWFPRRENVLDLGRASRLGGCFYSSGNPLPAHESGGVDNS